MTDWIEWAGGENPVLGRMVEVQRRYRRGMKPSGNVYPSSEFYWGHRPEGRGRGDDIIAYRLAAQPASEQVGMSEANAPKDSPAPTAPVGVDREKVARIIDPMAFDVHRYVHRKNEAAWAENKAKRLEVAFAKADAILALSASPQPGEGGSGEAVPVAWRAKLADEPGWVMLKWEPIEDRLGYHSVQPLYDHPAPASRDGALADALDDEVYRALAKCMDVGSARQTLKSALAALSTVSRGGFSPVEEQ